MKTQLAAAPFHVLVKPIGPSCNLACEYCFYLDKAGMFPDSKSFRMSDAVLERFTRQYIEGQPEETAEVNFAWQGGEPTLLGIEFYRRAREFQEKYRRPDLKITNALQTNGMLLDDEWGRFLHENEFLVGISIDGPEELHDRFRKDKSGKGSFARVMKGLEALKRHQVEFNTLTVVQRDNGPHPERVYEFLKDIGTEFMQFIPIVEPEANGPVSERSVLPRQWGDFLHGVFEQWRRHDIGTIYVQYFEMMLGIIMGSPGGALCVHSRTCGRSVALEHNGNLYSCDHFVFPEYLLGNIAEHSLGEMLDGDQQMKFGQDKFDALPGYCRNCEFLPFCFGGCPGHRLIKSPDGQPGLNYLCQGYLSFYSYTLKYFRAMAECLRRQRPSAEYRNFLQPRQPAGVHPGKVGRNDPCPCGSGKKYKKCCGRSQP